MVYKGIKKISVIILMLIMEVLNNVDNNRVVKYGQSCSFYDKRRKGD